MVSMLAQSTGLQNVYAPFPIKFHIVFCIIATVVYALQYTRQKSVHYLLMALAVDATLVTQFCTDSIIITCLFVLEVVLLAASAYFSHKFNKAKKLQKQHTKKSASESE